jgi:hypothetical protein
VSGPSTPLPAELRARILEAARNEPVPTRAAGRIRRIRALSLGFGALLAALAILGPRNAGRPPGYVLAMLVAWLPIAALATWAGVSPGKSMLGRPAALRAAVVVLTPLAMVVTWVAVAQAWPSTLHDASGPRQHVFCDGLTFALSLGPLLAFAAIRRASDPVTPRLTGAAIATVAAAWGAIVLNLLCAFTAPIHILLGHVAPVVFLALVGTVLTARTVAVRTKTE